MELIREQKAEIWRNDALRKAERAATFAHIREQAARDDVIEAVECLGDVPIWEKFIVMLDQIERTDNATK
jgi:hypothetical protein